MYKKLYVNKVVNEDLPDILEPWKNEIKQATKKETIESA